MFLLHNLTSHVYGFMTVAERCCKLMLTCRFQMYWYRDFQFGRYRVYSIN